MTFDALTIAGIVSAAISGGFVLVTAALQSPRWSVHRRSSSAATGTRVHIGRPVVSVFRIAARKGFRPVTADLTSSVIHARASEAETPASCRGFLWGQRWPGGQFC
jgi:hypothetical protein